VYWIPVLEILESGGLATLLVDTRALSRVPGRKTDVSDCRWLQTLHSHGLLQGSYRPSEEISQLRSLVRGKATLVAEQADWIRRLQKSLDQMNVRVHQAVSDLSGTTGMAIVRAIVAGERDPQKLAGFRDPRFRKSQEEIVRLLTGHWRADHLFNLANSLKMYDAHQDRIAEYEEEIQRRMKQLTPAGRQDQSAPALPNRERMKAIKRRHQDERRQILFRMVGADLTTIDGIGVETAEAVVSEYGIDLHQFAHEKKFVAHLQLAPHSPKSGGKPLKKKRRTKRTSRAGQALQTAAVTLGRSATALGAYYRHIARKKGPDVAVFATARKLGTLAYRLLRWGQEYVDIGQKAYEELYQKARLRALAKTASQLGYQLPKTEVTTRWDSRRNGSTVDPTGHALRCRPRSARGFPPNF
jgi:transposase